VSWALALIPPLTSHEVVPFGQCPKCGEFGYHLMAEQMILKERYGLSGYYPGQSHASRQGFTNPNTNDVEANVYRTLNDGTHVVVLIRECVSCRVTWSEVLTRLRDSLHRYQDEMRTRHKLNVRVA
jgi:hypothetical protein